MLIGTQSLALSYPVRMSFKKDKHARYWRMCANILPDAYTSSDASRMFLGFFIVAAMDLLDVLDTNEDAEVKKSVITASDREGWIDWIYDCQVPDGEGFRGFTGTDLRDRRTNGNRRWDPGNLPNTFFALSSLLILGDDLARVQRDKCLQWLPRLQRPDGSFGEILGLDGQVEGGRDLRYCCCAAGIAYIFLDPLAESYEPAFDEERLVDYILSCQNYNGGYGESPLREPHSGLNYCAIATLELISRLKGPGSDRARQALNNSDRCIRWLLDRQTTVLYDEAQAQDDEAEDEQEGSFAKEGVASFAKAPMYYSPPEQIVGFNGRDNKIADTCYCFWNSGALAVGLDCDA